MVGRVTAAALFWALFVARADARKANERAAANLLAADDALSAIQEYLEDVTEGRTAFDDVFPAGSWLSNSPFERFRLEIQEVDMSNLPSQWSRRALRRARACVEEIAPQVAGSIENPQSSGVSGAELRQIAHQIEICRTVLTPDLPPGNFQEWVSRTFRPPRRQRPTRLGRV